MRGAVVSTFDDALKAAIKADPSFWKEPTKEERALCRAEAELRSARERRDQASADAVPESVEEFVKAMHAVPGKDHYERDHLKSKIKKRALAFCEKQGDLGLMIARGTIREGERNPLLCNCQGALAIDCADCGCSYAKHVGAERMAKSFVELAASAAETRGAR